MRKLINIIIAGTLLAGAVILPSCTGNFEKYNRNPDQAGELNLSVWNYLSNMQYAIMCSNIKNEYQIVENTSGGAYGRYFAYAKAADANGNWPAGMFAFYGTSTSWSNPPFEKPMQRIYSNWRDLLKELGDDAEGDYGMAIAQILRVATMQRLTDQQGPIPYRTMENTTGISSVYESQEAVYGYMLEDLATAIADIQKYITILGDNVIEEEEDRNEDHVYAGDLSKWVKFGNSLMLRMAMRISFVDPETAKTYAEKAVSDAFGVMTSNSDNASIDLSGSNDKNVLYQMVGYKDVHAAAEIVTYMKSFDDPRLEKYFAPAVKTGTIEGSRVGVKSFADWFNDYSLPLVSESDRLMWMNAAEVAFLRAEMALNGWAAGGTAEEFYKDGIRLSFEQYGISGSSPDYSAYVANTSTPKNYIDPKGGNSYFPTTPYTVTVAWDSSNREKQLEKIITQKWIALYPLGTEAWAEQRRTGYPRFYPTPPGNNQQAATEPNLPYVGASRLLFAPNEKTLNAENYEAAVGLLGEGGDKFGTRLWWDVRTNKPAW